MVPGQATVFYISHPQVLIDPDTPVPQWGLSDVGRARCDAVRGASWLATIVAAYSSAETKATETLGSLLPSDHPAERHVREAMHENDRSATGFVPPDAFEKLADAFFAKPDESVEGWETARDAQVRIVRETESALCEAASGSVLLVGHGGVGTLLLCHLLDKPIARIRDQPGGGGNVFAFDRESRSVHHPWIAMEEVEAKHR